MSETQLLDVIRREIKAAGSMRKLAFRWNVCPATLSNILRGKQKPGPLVLVNLGLVRVRRVEYVPAPGGG